MASKRESKIILDYKGSKLYAKLQSRLESFSYTEVASGSSDSISATIENIDKSFLTKNIPQLGDVIEPQIFSNFYKEAKGSYIKCGAFHIDTVEFSGRPLVMTIEGLSQPADSGFRNTTRTKTWNNTTIEQIASEIAKNAGIKLVYDADTVQVKENEQNTETDSSFLSGLCKDYGLAIKIYNDKLVIFDEVKYEKKDPVVIISENDMISWNYSTTLEGAYTGVKVGYTGADKKTVKYLLGTEDRLLTTSPKVATLYDAELRAKALLHEANKKLTTMNVTVPSDPKIYASCNVQINGVGTANGIYYVDKITHSAAPSTMKLQLHFVRGYYTEDN